ncbi:ubiquinone anaerobic biosynthesis protein UbiU [Brevundimonas sp.]|uniref:ubiquinone anaerobic biosynthesis protein UbiU n=1 Tax=Brevundimonas sp. TaxID=1871086 RepID=UPI002ED7D622
MGSIELVCPAGSPAMLRAAIEAGADSVYCGLRDDTNARNFPGLNFSPAELRDSVAWAHDRGARVLLAVNTFARAGAGDRWRASVDAAAGTGVDAVIVADLGVLAHARTAHPDLRLHLSVQAAAGSPEAIAFYAEAYGVKRVVLPRVLSVEEIAALMREITVETEAFVFGGLCVMAEGRCALSSYVTGRSPNLSGVCSPPESVTYTEEEGALVSRLGGLALDRYAPGEPAGYPTLCKGRFEVDGGLSYLFEDPVSLNAMSLLAALRRAGVTAVKIEGRQRGKAYVARVASAFRGAIDALDRSEDPARFETLLADLAEGGRETAGAYRKTWR